MCSTKEIDQLGGVMGITHRRAIFERQVADIFNIDVYLNSQTRNRKLTTARLFLDTNAHNFDKVVKHYNVVINHLCRELFQLAAQEVAANGDCLFESISVANKQGKSGLNGKELRKRAVGHMRSTAELDGENVDENYLNKMSKEGVWAGSVELQALSNVLCTDIHVYFLEWSSSEQNRELELVRQLFSPSTAFIDPNCAPRSAISISFNSHHSHYTAFVVLNPPAMSKKEGRKEGTNQQRRRRRTEQLAEEMMVRTIIHT